MEISAKEILKEAEIKNNLKECFKKCAAGRQRLRGCVVDLMNNGLSKSEILTIINEMGSGAEYDESSLCSIVAIGQAMRYEEKYPSKKSIKKSNNNKNSKNKLRECLKTCVLARRKLRKCVINALNIGLSKEEILAFTDEIVGGVGKDDVSLCGIIATDQVLRFEESIRAKPIDIVKEREFE
jgi:hypothetical protein